MVPFVVYKLTFLSTLHNIQFQYRVSGYKTPLTCHGQRYLFKPGLICEKISGKGGKTSQYQNSDLFEFTTSHMMFLRIFSYF